MDKKEITREALGCYKIVVYDNSTVRINSGRRFIPVEEISFTLQTRLGKAIGKELKRTTNPLEFAINL